MIILAHRGLWKQSADKNSLGALRDALAAGFGVETDIRDHNGRLVISHDPAGANAPSLVEFFEAYAELGRAQVLALNIKADGLQQLLRKALTACGIGPEYYFVFDMAVPDALGYLRLAIPSFTRQSELEPDPAFIDQASGVWLDCFTQEWINEGVILRHCAAGRKVALVSPELHGRNPHASWAEWRHAYRNLCQEDRSNRIMICTDLPHEARMFFNAHD